MTNPFEQLKNKEKSKGFKFDIEKWMNESSKPKKSSICALFVGHPKTGKTGCALDCRTDEDKKQHKKIIAIELNSDQGCEINKKIHHNDDPDIIVLNPREYSLDENGEWQPDYIKTMAKIKALIQYIRDSLGELNLKALVFDGLDIFLSEICEAQMRIDEHIDVSGGVSMRFWKKRNEYYYKILNMIFDIDVDKYFITHYAERRRDDNTGEYTDDRTPSKLNPNLVYACQKSTADKMHQIVEFTDETKVVSGVMHRKLTATIISDRRSLKEHMKPILIAEVEGDKVKWSGQAILERGE